jgi:ABC-2 type transport system ATP-binding protein
VEEDSLCPCLPAGRSHTSNVPSALKRGRTTFPLETRRGRGIIKDMAKCALKVTNLTKVFPGKFSLKTFRRGKSTVAVDNVSFTIDEGEIVGLLGPNGAGKTTTTTMLLGTTTKSSGEITYFGKPFEENRSEILKQLNYVSAYARLPWRMTVWENLMVFATMYEVPDKKKRITKLLSAFEMEEYASKTFASLSAGQKTRVLIAKSFLNYPKLLLLDEPTASLDPDIAVSVREFLLTQQKKYGVAMLFTSHNMAEVAEVCDRVIFLRKGKIVAQDTPEGLAKQIQLSSVTMTIVDGMKRARAYLKELHLGFEEQERILTVRADEEEVAKILRELAKKDIQYSTVTIEKPTLEDYFLWQSRGDL